MQTAFDSFRFSFHFFSVKRASDLQENLEDFAFDLVQPFLLEARKQRMEGEFHHEREYKFFKSRPALLIYADCWLALVFKRPWILYGAALVILSQIAWTLFVWILYIVDDNKELQENYRFVNGWLQVFLREGRSLFKGRDAIRYVVAGTMLKSCPTGFNYFKMVMRYRMHEMNKNVVKADSDRFSRVRKYAESISDVQKKMLDASERRRERLQERRDRINERKADESSNLGSIEENGFDI